MQSSTLESNRGHIEWKPDEKIYKTIVSALNSSCDSVSNEVQMEVTKVLKDLTDNVSDAGLYLLHIFLNKEEKSDARQVGGLLLKNYIHSKNKHLTSEILKIIKNEIFKSLEDEVREIRGTGGSVITTISTLCKGIENWPEALYNLLILIDRGNNDVLDGAFRTILIIVEDELNSTKEQENSMFFQFCKSHLLQKLFAFCAPQEKGMKKKYAVECLDLFVSASCFNTNGVFNNFFPQLWECLGFLASEEDTHIIKIVVKCMTIITETRYSSIFTNLDAIIQFMVNATNSEDRKVQMEALEFWPIIIKDRSYMAYNAGNSSNTNTNSSNLNSSASTVGGVSGTSSGVNGNSVHANNDAIIEDFSKSEGYMDEALYKSITELRKEALKTLKKYLPYLCKILIDNAVYTKWDYLTMDESHFQNDNANIPDLLQDISPEIYNNSKSCDMADEGYRMNKVNNSDRGGTNANNGMNNISNSNTNISNNNNSNDANNETTINSNNNKSCGEVNVCYGETKKENGSNQEEFGFSRDEDGKDFDDLDEDEENDGDQMMTRTWGNDWTVRKGAALCLDYLSNVYNDEILEFILPHIEEKLMSDKWYIRESAVLALGAIAKGCMYSLSPFIPKVLEYLIKLLNDEKPLARSISCWCVTRFSSWICSAENAPKWFEIVLLNLLKRVLDSNKRVQEAACSSLANLEEDALDLLNGYLHEIVNTIQQAFQIYQTKNYFILFDVVSTLIDSVNIVKDDCELAHRLGACVLTKWNNIRINSPYIIALMECMSCIANAYGREFLKYAHNVIRTCIKLLALLYIDLEDDMKYYFTKKIYSTDTYLMNKNELSVTARELLNFYKISDEEYFVCLKDIDSISPSKKKDLIECSFDLLCRFLSVMDVNAMDIVGQSELNFVPLVHRYCLKFENINFDDMNKFRNDLKMLNHSDPTVKNGILNQMESPALAKEFLNFGILQSNFALIGDVSRLCTPLLVPYLNDIIPFLIAHITHPSTPVSNNASWAIGEISLHIDAQYMEMYVDEIIKQLIFICHGSNYHGCLLQNICITLGRFAAAYPKKVIYYLPQFLKSWLSIMAHGTQENEKINSLKAILETLYLNLDIAAANLKEIVYIILEFKCVSPQMNMFFHQFLTTMKQKYPVQWNSIYQTNESDSIYMSEKMLDQLRTRFNL